MEVMRPAGLEEEKEDFQEANTMRKISRRSFLKASAVVAGAAALAACGGSDSSSTAASTATSSAASGSASEGATNQVWTKRDKKSTA